MLTQALDGITNEVGWDFGMSVDSGIDITTAGLDTNIQTAGDNPPGVIKQLNSSVFAG